MGRWLSTGYKPKYGRRVPVLFPSIHFRHWRSKGAHMQFLQKHHTPPPPPPRETFGYFFRSWSERAGVRPPNSFLDERWKVKGRLARHCATRLPCSKTSGCGTRNTRFAKLSPLRERHMFISASNGISLKKWKVGGKTEALGDIGGR